MAWIEWATHCTRSLDHAHRGGGRTQSTHGDPARYVAVMALLNFVVNLVRKNRYVVIKIPIHAGVVPKMLGARKSMHMF